MTLNNIPALNESLYKRLRPIALVFSIIVILMVASLRSIHWETNISFIWLAGFHSTVNAITAIGLILAYYFIKIKKDIKRHKQLMILNIILSGVFLLSYVVYHITTPETKYCFEGNIRYLYFVLLATHIILAAIIMPVVIFTFLRAYTGFIPLHKKMARWAFPVWLYVAITGPILYLMLRPCM